MDKVTIEITTGNAAFADGGLGEVARILRELAKRFDRGDFPISGPLRDINGNTCGRVSVE